MTIVYGLRRDWDGILMKKHTFFRALFLGLAVVAVQNAHAGSAVVWDGHGHVQAAWGHPVEQAKTLALQKAQQLYGGHFRLIAYSSVEGYGAIAVARNGKGSGSLIGVTLGQASEREARELSVEKCLKAGGVTPKVARVFKG